MSSSRIIRIALAATSLAFAAGTLLAQGEEDALRTSTLRPGGTARSNGMANAFGAVGADPGSFSINPAGDRKSVV